MKKFLIGLIILIVAVSTCVNAEEKRWLSPEVEEIIRQKLTEDDIKMIAEKYGVSTEEVKKINENSTILKINYSVFWENGHLPLNERLETISGYKRPYYFYLAFDEKTGYLNNKITDGGKTKTFEVYYRKNEEMHSYLEDLRNLKKEFDFNGEVYTLKDIAIFDAHSSSMEACVYLVCDKGTIVKVYDDKYSQAVFYTEDEFRYYAEEYYVKVLKNQPRLESGETQHGGVMSFLSFVKNYEEYKDKESVYDDFEKETQENNDEKPTDWLNIAIISGGAGAIIVAVALAICIKKGKK